MPFNALLNAAKITQVRQRYTAFRSFLLLCPNTVVFQAQVNETLTNKVYAEFDWTNTLQGAYTSVEVGQTVLITDSADDLTAPLWRGRVRKAPDASVFYINESGYNLTTSHYVTVIDDYDIHDKLQKVGDDNAVLKDWERTYVNLPPIITNLQSVYVDITASDTVDFVWSPTVIATASGATVSSYLWDIADGTYQSGSSTTQNITARFASTTEHRWVRLTVTDSNGVVNYFVFQVYTIDLADHSSSVIELDADAITITGSLMEGFNATIPYWDGLDSIIPQTRAVLISDVRYGKIGSSPTTTPIVANVDMVGRLPRKSLSQAGTADGGTTTDNSIQLQGFGTQLARTPAPSLYIIDDATPTAWGEIADPTPKRAIVYLLAYHTTALNVMALSFHTDADNYVDGELSIEQSGVLDNINRQCSYINAQIMFCPSGEATIRRNANYQTTAERAALTTIFTFTTQDVLGYSVDIDYEDTIGQVQAGAVCYNTTYKQRQFYQSRSPAESLGESIETTLLDGQILAANATNANARLECGQRGANHLAYMNPAPILRLTLAGGWYFIIPSNYQWWKLSGIAGYTDATRWFCTDISWSQDNATGTRVTQATFRQETSRLGYGIWSSVVPSVDESEVPSISPWSPYPDFPLDPLTNYPTDDPDSDYGSGNFIPPDANSDAYSETPSQLDCETLNVSMRTGTAKLTTNITVAPNPYTITIEGQAYIGAISTPIVYTYDFTLGIAESYYDITGTLVPGVGIKPTIVVDGADHFYRAAVGIYVPTTNVTKVETYYYYEKGQVEDPGEAGFILGYDGVTKLSKLFPTMSNGNQITTYSSAATNVADRIGVRINCSHKHTGGDPSPLGDGTLKKVVVTTSNTTSENVYGDAFYYGYTTGDAQLYAAGKGLLLNGAKPGDIPSYDPSHQYNLNYAGDDDYITFTWVDPDGDYSDNANINLVVTVCGEGMNSSPL